MNRSLGSRVAWLVPAVLGIGCSKDATAPSEMGPIRVSLVSGGGQSGIVGRELPQPLVVQATDSEGNPIRRWTVNFVLTSGGGSVFAAAISTDQNGKAADYWTLGTSTAQPQRLEVRTVSSAGEKQVFGVFTATALAGPAAGIAIQAGNNQRAHVGTAVAVAPAVLVTDQYENPVPNVPVTFAVASGGGSLSEANPTTSPNGVATVGSWTLGTAPGANSLTATVSTSGIDYSVGFAATGEPVALRNVIIYITEEFGLPEVAIVRPDGSDRRRLTTDQAAYAAPVISPDGQRIAVAVYPGTLALMNADATGLTKIGRAAFDGSPAWSPDGRWIAFRSENQGPYGPFGRIFVINADGTGLRQVTPDTPDYTFDDGPTWSPDGKRIAFARNGLLYVINVDGSALTALPTAPEGARYPAWSPDGAHIAYAGQSGSWPIYIANADGSNLIRVTTDAAQKEMPRWSPDEQQLVFARVLNGIFQLFRINIDGTAEVKLSATTVSEDWPSWSPLP